MAGVIPIVPPPQGVMGGKLEVETPRFLTVNELREHAGAINEFLKELEMKSWRFLLIDSHGLVVMEMELEEASYVWKMYEAPRGGYAYALSFDFGRRLPKLTPKRIVRLENCIFNICSAEFPRAVTIDLTTNEITYVHECLWVQKGKGCHKEACNVLKILRWLVEEKQFLFQDGEGNTHYRDIIKTMGEC
jgi:hypothetical protein